MDLFLPTTRTISLHTVSLTPSIAFTSSSTPISSALSFIIISAPKSIVCSPILYQDIPLLHVSPIDFATR